jgi:protein-disulfide isomerase
MSRFWFLTALAGLTATAAAFYLANPHVVDVDQTEGSSSAAPQSDNKTQMETVIRQYILDHPEVLIQSVNGMNERESGKALKNLRVELENGFPGAVGGNPNGDVTLVEFFDFRCPFCRTAHEEVAKVIAADPNVKIVYRDIPILDAPGQPPLSRRAAQLALAAAKQGKYKAFYDRVFAAPGRISQESLVAAVRATGLDEKRAVRDMESDDIRKGIERNLKLASTIGIDGTPGFVIGDELFVGAKNASELLAAIKRVREKDRQEKARSSAG